MRCASAPSSADLAHGDDLVEDLEVAAGQERAAVDDHVDLVGARLRRRRGCRRACTASEARPDGNAVATAATFTPLSPSSALGEADEVVVDADGRGRAAPTGRAGRGAAPSRTACAPCPGCRRPRSVVRSIIEMARSMAKAFDVVLIDRVDSAAARASAPTWSTPGRPCRKRRSAASERVTSASDAGVVEQRGGGSAHLPTLGPPGVRRTASAEPPGGLGRRISARAPRGYSAGLAPAAWMGHRRAVFLEGPSDVS